MVGCLADGLVRTALQSHPTDNCLHCNPAVSTSGWSADTGQTCTDGDLCTGPDTCTAAAVCTGPAVCTGQTPTCVSGSGVCQCSPGPPDSCAVGTNSFHCLGDGTCGCLDSNGCAAGFICGPSNGCVACDADPAVCGNTCADCRSLPQSVGEGNSYQCTSNVLPLAQACQLAPCAAGRADCNGLDVDACETNLTNQPASCGSCTTVCASGACANGMCDCGASTCPHGQQCRNGRCRCRNDGECDQAAGYQCNTNNDRCER